MVIYTSNFSKAPDYLKDKRRLYNRFQSRYPVKFKDTRFDFGTNVYLRNVSAEGVRITTTERQYLYDSVTLEVELNDGKAPLLMRGEVVWVNKIDEEKWDVGIKFHKVIFMDLWRIYKSVEDGSSV